MHRSLAAFARAWPAILLPLLALIVVTPLIAHGCSCGHDFEFHLESWLDAATQMRHGTLDPAWTVTAAWNAGEPRFLFYPPVSWMFGALLALTMPLSAAPIVFTGVALLGSGNRDVSARARLCLAFRRDSCSRDLHRKPLHALHRVRTNRIRRIARRCLDSAAASRCAARKARHRRRSRCRPPCCGSPTHPQPSSASTR